MEVRTISQEMEMYSDKFQSEFFSKFGIGVSVIYNLDFNSANAPLSTLINVANECLSKCIDQTEYPGGIRNRTRKREIVLHRQCYMKIARDYKHGLENIASKIGFHHAGVVHAQKVIPNLLQTNNIEATDIYNCIINGIKKNIGHDGDVQSDTEGEPNT